MNTAMHGTDLWVEVDGDGFRPRGLLEAVTRVWPGAWVEPADEGEARPVAEVLAHPDTPVGTEFFVYKDRTAADTWDRDGWTEAHGNDMVHVLVTPAREPGRLTLTVVVDSITGELYALLGELDEAVWRMSPEWPDRPGHGRVNWETELRAAGYEAGRDQFYGAVDQCRARLYPDWTADELACHPIQALHFCEEVRRQLGPGIPDYLVMKALLNLRKQGNGRAAFRPRLVPARTSQI